MKRELNLRDLGYCGSDLVPQRLYLRSGKLSLLSKDECAKLCRKYDIKCVIDLRTPVESAEFPDILPDEVDYQQISLVKSATVGITHERSTDPVAVTRQLRSNPDLLKTMIPDLSVLYAQLVTDTYSREQLDKVVALLRQNAKEGKCTLFHCTAGKDRTGIVSMALLKSYGVSDEIIIKDYLKSNFYTFLPTMKKCLGIGLMTRNLDLAKTIYKCYMAQRELIEIAIKNYNNP